MAKNPFLKRREFVSPKRRYVSTDSGYVEEMLLLTDCYICIWYMNKVDELPKKGEVKVKVFLEQVLKAQRKCRGIALLFL
jgi:hypothetical protein